MYMDFGCSGRILRKTWGSGCGMQAFSGLRVKVFGLRPRVQRVSSSRSLISIPLKTGLLLGVLSISLEV